MNRLPDRPDRSALTDELFEWIHGTLSYRSLADPWWWSATTTTGSHLDIDIQVPDLIPAEHGIAIATLQSYSMKILEEEWR